MAYASAEVLEEEEGSNVRITKYMSASFCRLDKELFHAFSYEDRATTELRFPESKFHNISLSNEWRKTNAAAKKETFIFVQPRA